MVHRYIAISFSVIVLTIKEEMVTDMDLHTLTRKLKRKNDTKIVLVVADGLGGLPVEPNGKTELETAATPHLDDLACRGVTGLSIPVLPGITPGSGPGHLGLFGYDPLEYDIGRGVLEALGIDFQVGPEDLAVRGNFCTLDQDGLITDRRAGRIANELCVRLCGKLSQIELRDVRLFVEPVREHRFVVVFRGEGLSDGISDTDPQATGAAPLSPQAGDPSSQYAAEVVASFLQQAEEVLKEEYPANMVTLRGFSRYPEIPEMSEVYGLRSGAFAVYPMYRGLARLVGMTVEEAGKTLTEQVQSIQTRWDDYDFFFLHYKYTDSTGEDGNFSEKVSRIEELDSVIPDLMKTDPQVLIVTGDHSTPSLLRSHSWHPVPTLLVSPNCRPDQVSRFEEATCLSGGLGQFPAKYLLTLALAHAGRLEKYGA